MGRVKRLLTNWRILILLVSILFALIVINPNPWNKGVTIRFVDRNSSASQSGMVGADPALMPMSKEKIIAINNKAVEDTDGYYAALGELRPNKTVSLKTNKASYLLTARPLVENSSVIGVEDLGITVYNAPTSNIRKGLDLEGGTRILLEPADPVSASDFDTLIEIMKQRLNVYGLSDVTVREAKDISGKRYIIIEMAGVSEEEMKGVIAKQGKFEARIGNETAFSGSEVTYVCRSAECSGIDPNVGCGQVQTGEWSCRFRFSIALSQEAAKHQAELTSGLSIATDTTGSEEYLDKNLDLYLDDQLVDSLRIGADLKGREVTDIQISGPGFGGDQKSAVYASLANMKKLQTLLITGSLPVKLNIVKTDTVSPTLGRRFTKNAITVAIAALAMVVLVLLLVYRKLSLSLPILLTGLIEFFITLGFYTLLGMNLDMAAIAGLITAIGSGIDDQIVITDEIIKGSFKRFASWRDSIKSAFYIIIGGYLTTLAAMIPLLFAGAGLLKGFAVTTIIGITVGTFITRPAYAVFMEISS